MKPKLSEQLDALEAAPVCLCCDKISAEPDTRAAVLRALERKISADRIAERLGVAASTFRRCRRNGHTVWR
jgi:hypothetical protein